MRLEHAPLVEALVELRWKLQQPAEELRVDPHYQLLLGRLSDKVAVEYPHYERLPTASIPEEMAGYLVQHRFRHADRDHPLIQLGPGILTFNETAKYDPKDFRGRVIKAIDLLYRSYPDSSKLEIDSLQLRYINAEAFDYENNDLFVFLQAKMNVGLSLPPTLFSEYGVESLPNSLSWQSAFRSSSPAGDVVSRFVTGEKEGQRALIWETMVTSTGAQVPEMPDGFSQWFDEAHRITDGWFWKLIAGDLERKYRDG